MRSLILLTKRSSLLITSLLLVFIFSSPALAASIIFEDNGQRANATSPGYSWEEYFMRESEGRIARSGDTPWSIQGNSIYYQASGQNSYIEDFIQTSETFPVDNTVIEFDFRGSAGTTAGYVGPVVLWATDAEQRTGFVQANDGRAAIGVQAWYRWENGGTRGLILHKGGSFSDYGNAVFAGLNQQEFSHHRITVKDNNITYESDQFPELTLPLSSALASGEQRHLSLGVRLYDQGVPQIVEFRNIRITSLGEDGADVLPPDTLIPHDTDINNPHSDLNDPSHYYQTSYQFLQSVLNQDFSNAITLTSTAFQNQPGKSGLLYLRDYLLAEGEGTVVGKSASVSDSGVYVIVFVEYENGARLSVHLNFEQGLIDTLMVRWGR